MYVPTPISAYYSKVTRPYLGNRKLKFKQQDHVAHTYFNYPPIANPNYPSWAFFGLWKSRPDRLKSAATVSHTDYNKGSNMQ